MGCDSCALAAPRAALAPLEQSQTRLAFRDEERKTVAQLGKTLKPEQTYGLDQAAHQQARLAYKKASQLVNKRPGHLAAQGLQDACLVAMVEEPPGASAPAAPATTHCIEVVSVSGLDGSFQTVYRVPIPSLCTALTFCYKSTTCLLCSCAEGLQLLFNLYNSETSCAYDNPGVRSVSISTDMSMICSAEGNFFKVYKDNAEDDLLLTMFLHHQRLPVSVLRQLLHPVRRNIR
eukprot:s1098_g24.t1